MLHSWLFQGQLLSFKLPKHEELQGSQSTVSCNPAGRAAQMEVRSCFPVKEGSTLASQWHKLTLESFHTHTWSEQGQKFPGELHSLDTSTGTGMKQRNNQAQIWFCSGLES